jgi:hypothetical protein
MNPESLPLANSTEESSSWPLHRGWSFRDLQNLGGWRDPRALNRYKGDK